MIDVPNLAGDISPRTVEDGFKALLAVEAYLKAGGGPQLAALCGAFYTYGLSPHIMQLSAQHASAHHGAEGGCGECCRRGERRIERIHHDR